MHQGCRWADGLDRVRINDLNPAYLRTNSARNLVAAAWELYRVSDGEEAPWEAVLEAARSTLALS